MEKTRRKYFSASAAPKSGRLPASAARSSASLQLEGWLDELVLGELVLGEIGGGWFLKMKDS